jgi:hypothetical protein
MTLTLSETAEILTRSATLRPTSWNAATREADVVFATSNRVRVVAPGIGPAWEELEISAAAMDLSSLNGGNAPLLDGHNQREARAIVGRIVSAKIVNGVATARVRLSEADDVQPIGQRIGDGTIRNVSVGYRVRRHKRMGEQDGLPVLRAIEWQPVEISLVAIPADPAATIRSDAGRAASSPTKEPSMLDNPAPADDAGNAAVAADRARVSAIFDAAELARARGVTTANDIARRAVADGWDATRTRGELFGAIVAADQARGTPAPTPVSQFGRSYDDPAFRLQARADALAAQILGKAPPAHARDQMEHRGFTGMASAILSDAGVATRGLSPASMIDAALQTRSTHTTSDFPALLVAAGDRMLAALRDSASSPIRAVCRPRDVADFRPYQTITAAGPSVLQQLNEGGEVTHTTFFASSEAGALGTYARNASITRQMLVNDDLGVFALAARFWASGIGETERRLFVKMFEVNGAGFGPTMSDGEPLFSAAHGNVATGAASTAGLGTARQTLRQQRDLNGNILGYGPAMVLTGPASETALEQVVSSTTIATSEAQRAIFSAMRVEVEAGLTGAPFFVFADPVVAPVIEYVTLAGRGGAPMFETFTGPDRDGLVLRCVHDVAITACSWVGAVRMTGT